MLATQVPSGISLLKIDGCEHASRLCSVTFIPIARMERKLVVSRCRVSTKVKVSAFFLVIDSFRVTIVAVP